MHACACRSPSCRWCGAKEEKLQRDGGCPRGRRDETQALTKRGQHLEDAYEWLSFSADATEESLWFSSHIASAQAAQTAPTLQDNLALLAKHDELTSDVTEHSERVEDILAVGDRLTASNNVHASEVKARSDELKAKVATMTEAVKTFRAEYVASLDQRPDGRGAGGQRDVRLTVCRPAAAVLGRTRCGVGLLWDACCFRLDSAIRIQEFERDARIIETALTNLQPRVAGALPTSKDAIAKALREVRASDGRRHATRGPKGECGLPH